MHCNKLIGNDTFCFCNALFWKKCLVADQIMSVFSLLVISGHKMIVTSLTLALFLISAAAVCLCSETQT